MPALPLAVRLSWWGTSWMQGLIGADEFLDGMLLGAGRDAMTPDVAHVVVDEVGAEPLLLVLAGARRDGANAVAAVFPVAGDPHGLRAPGAAVAEAVEAGEAVLLLGSATGLVPHRVGRAVEWHPIGIDRRPPPDLGDADRQLRSILLSTANELARLDVAQWAPDVADHLHDLRTAEPLVAPPGVPGRALDLAGRALHLHAVVDLAEADEGGALSAAQTAARRSAVAGLARAARHALTASCAPDGWPPAS